LHASRACYIDCLEMFLAIHQRSRALMTSEAGQAEMSLAVAEG
jgi:hypothetical protein